MRANQMLGQPKSHRQAVGSLRMKMTFDIRSLFYLTTIAALISWAVVNLGLDVLGFIILTLLFNHIVGKQIVID